MHVIFFETLTSILLVAGRFGRRRINNAVCLKIWRNNYSQYVQYFKRHLTEFEFGKTNNLMREWVSKHKSYQINIRGILTPKILLKNLGFRDPHHISV